MLYALDADDALQSFDFQNPIDHQKRIAMRRYFWISVTSMIIRTLRRGARTAASSASPPKLSL